MSDNISSEHAPSGNALPENAPRDIAQASTARRRRYTRAPGKGGLLTLTPVKVQMLLFLAEMRFLSLPQLAQLCCPSKRADLSHKNARKHLRPLFDAGLVSVLPISRLALASPDAPNDETLLYGSAPNVYVPTMEGLQTLFQAGLIGREWVKRPPAAYGPKNSLFLAHELQVRDVRVWLEGCARSSGSEQNVLIWKDGQEAVIDSGHGAAHRVRPDAWFVYQVKPAPDAESQPTVLVAFVEVDRGTERGTTRWQEKVDTYGALFTGEGVWKATGYLNARILVITPNTSRRDHLVNAVKEAAEKLVKETERGTLLQRFWMAEYSVLRRYSMQHADWKRVQASALCSLIPLR